MRLFRELMCDRHGATAIEYGLIAAIMSVALISGFGVLSGSVQGTLETVEAAITSAWH
jgi:pilus assembly protein Flp/PilA